MPIDARIPLLGTTPPDQKFDVSGALFRGGQLSALRSRAAGQEFDLEEAESKRELNQARREATVFSPDGSLDTQRTRRNLAEIGDQEGVLFIEDLQRKEEDRQLDRRKTEADIGGIEARKEKTLADTPTSEEDQLAFEQSQADLADTEAGTEATKAQPESRRLIRAETKRHNKAMEKAATQRGGTAADRAKETARHNRRMEVLGGAKAAGGDPVERRSIAREGRAEVRKLGEQRSKLNQSRLRLRKVLETPEGDDFSYVNRSGTVVSGTMDEKTRKAIRDEAVRNENELLRVGRRQTELRFGDKVRRITADELNRFASHTGFATLGEAEMKLFDEGVVVTQGR